MKLVQIIFMKLVDFISEDPESKEKLAKYILSSSCKKFFILPLNGSFFGIIEDIFKDIFLRRKISVVVNIF